jgi:hypothetical protein
MLLRISATPNVITVMRAIGAGGFVIVMRVTPVLTL